MNFFISIVRGGSSSGSKRSSSSSASRGSLKNRRQRLQANSLMDQVGRMEDRG